MCSEMTVMSSADSFTELRYSYKKDLEAYKKMIAMIAMIVCYD